MVSQCHKLWWFVLTWVSGWLRYWPLLKAVIKWTWTVVSFGTEHDRFLWWWYRSPKRRAGPFKCLSLRQKKGPTTSAVQSFNCKHSHARIKFIKEGEMRVPRTQQCPPIVITDSFISDTFAQVRIAPTEDQQQPPKSKKRKDQDREDNNRCHQWYGLWTITAEGTKLPQIGQQFLYLDSSPQRFQSSSFTNQCAVINLWNAIWH